MERRSNWSFSLTQDGSWLWRVKHPDGTEAVSESTFRTLKDCTSDATKHGYVAWKTEEERRRR